MQSQTPVETKLNFEVVKSLRFPGNYACEAINSDGEGEITIVEFLSHDSRRLADEYAAFKNAQLSTDQKAA